MINLKNTWLLPATLESQARRLVHEGGSRSSKTYSVCQALIIKLHDPANKGLRVDVVRKTLPSLKATAMRDFFEILDAMGLYNPRWHNRTELIYRVDPYDTEIAFFGLDQPQKVRGRKRHILWANEANELTAEDYRQLRLRTSDQIIFDYNPSDQFHWIYDRVQPRQDCQTIKSTYLDNPFLEPALVLEIESLRDEDPEAWNVYGLGHKGANQALIYPTWSFAEAFPEADDPAYGLDVGFTNPTCLVQVAAIDEAPRKRLIWDELLYERRLTDEALIGKLRELGIDTMRPMYVDAAAAGTIQALIDAGFNAYPADKAVQDGLRTCRSYALEVTKRSGNLQKELRGYRRKTDRDGNVLEDPVKFNDHGCDAGRYATHTHYKQESWLFQ